MLYKVYKETAVHITASSQRTHRAEPLKFWLHRWILTFLIEPFCLVNFNPTQEIKKGKTNYCEIVFISKLNLKKGGRLAGWLGICFSYRPKMEDGRLRRPGAARAQPWIDICYSQCVKFCTLWLNSFCDKFEINF